MITLTVKSSVLTPETHPRLFTIGRYVAGAVVGKLTYVIEEESNGTSEYIWHFDCAGTGKRAILSKAACSVLMESNVIKELVKQVTNGR